MREKLNWSEAEAVVRAYRAEQGATSDIDVATLARALGTNVGEVRRLAGRKPRFVDRSGVLSAGLALLSVVAIAGLYPAAHRWHSNRLAPLASAPLETYGDLQIRVDGEDFRVVTPDGKETTRIYAESAGELISPRDTKL